MNTAENILSTIGQTPVLKLNKILPAPSAALYGKLEAGNPSFSLKDRVAKAIVEDLEKQKKILPNTVIVMASNGNSAVSMAMLCAVKKYALHLFITKGSTAEKRLIISKFGAQVELVEAALGFTATVAKAREFANQNPNAIYIDQFNCESVTRAHAETTAQEILADFPNGIDAFVMSYGTGGSLSGVGAVLKKAFPKILICAVEPESVSLLSGGTVGRSRIHQIGLGFVPQNLDRSLIDRVVTVSDGEAYLMTKCLAREEGLLVGISSGANVCAAVSVAQELGVGKTVLTVLCDQGQRYFSLEKYFKEG